MSVCVCSGGAQLFTKTIKDVCGALSANECLSAVEEMVCDGDGR